MSISDINTTFEVAAKGERQTILFWIFKGEISIVLISVIFIIIFTEYRRLKGLSNAVEQPPSTPFLGNLQFLSPKADKLKLLMDWTLKYGRIFKTTYGPQDFYVVNEPAMLRTILSSTDPSHLNKHRLLYDNAFEGAVSNGLIGADYDVWNPHRKILARSFYYKGLQQQQSIMNIYSKEFVKDCKGKAEDLQINEMINFSMIKSILHIILGSGMEKGDQADIHMFHEDFKTAKEINPRRILEPWLLIKPIWWLHPLSRKFKKVKENMDTFMQKILDNYKQKLVDKRSGSILEEDVDDVGTRKYKSLMEEMLDSGMNDREILDESITILIAGHETTSMSLIFLLLRLAMHSEHQEKCREEVDELFESKMGSEDVSPFDMELSMEDLSNLKYLERCAYENLRVAPIVPGMIRRLRGPIKLGWLKIDDKVELPAGSNICITPWALHRLPEIYPDPEKFDPDRFLPENVKNRHPFAYLPFSAGPRICMGWKTAILNIKLMTAWILRFYEIQTTDKPEDIKISFGVAIVSENEMNLTLKPRVHAQN